MRRRLLALAVVVAGTGPLLAACGDDGSASPAASTGITATTDAGAPAATDAASAETGAPVAPEALQFSAPLVGGGTLDLTRYAGRTVALWFWAPT